MPSWPSCHVWKSSPSSSSGNLFSMLFRSAYCKGIMSNIKRTKLELKAVGGDAGVSWESDWQMSLLQPFALKMGIELWRNHVGPAIHNFSFYYRASARTLHSTTDQKQTRSKVCLGWIGLLDYRVGTMTDAEVKYRYHRTWAMKLVTSFIKVPFAKVSCLCCVLYGVRIYDGRLVQSKIANLISVRKVRRSEST